VRRSSFSKYEEHEAIWPERFTARVSWNAFHEFPLVWSQADERAISSLIQFSLSFLGSQLELDEATVLGVLAACRAELGTLFGYTAENRGVGITGGVDYVDMDGPTVIVKLKGRFWHQRTTVLDRVANYLQQRIPEIIDVQVEDPWQLTDEANEVW
jgi:hypothetical protein